MHRDMETSLAAWEDALEGVDEPTVVGAFDADRGAAGARRGWRRSTGFGARRTRCAGPTERDHDEHGDPGGVGCPTVSDAFRDDVVFGVTVSGRSPELSGVENMMGLLINTLPVRVQLDPDETCTQLLARLQSEQTALLDHHYVGLGAIQSVVGTGNLFDTLSVFESYPIDTSGMGGTPTLPVCASPL